MAVSFSDFKLFDINLNRFNHGSIDRDEVEFVKKMTFTMDKRVVGNLAVMMRRLCYLVLHGEFFNAEAEAERLNLDQTVSSIQETCAPWIEAGKKNTAEKFALLSSPEFQKQFKGKEIGTLIQDLESILTQSQLAREVLSNISANAPEIKKLDGINEELTAALKFLKEYGFNQLMKKYSEGLKQGDVDTRRKQLIDYADGKDDTRRLVFWKSVNEMIPEEGAKKKPALNAEEQRLEEWNRPLTRDELRRKMERARSERDQQK